MTNTWKSSSVWSINRRKIFPNWNLFSRYSFVPYRSSLIKLFLRIPSLTVSYLEKSITFGFDCDAMIQCFENSFLWTILTSLRVSRRIDEWNIDLVQFFTLSIWDHDWQHHPQIQWNISMISRSIFYTSTVDQINLFRFGFHFKQLILTDYSLRKWNIFIDDTWTISNEITKWIDRCNQKWK